MDEMIFLPCRVHQDGVSGAVIVEGCGYQHLNLPLLVDEPSQVDRKSATEWFCSTWATRLKASDTPIIIMSRLHEEEGGQEK